MIHIALNIDEKYSDYASVLIKSVLKYNTNVNFHILHNGISESAKNRIKSNLDTGSLISFYIVDSSLFNGMPVSDQWPEAIYYRILIPSLLPHDINKVLYCDCDILIRGNIEELWGTEFNNEGVAAVEDILSPISPMLERLGCDPNIGYFNSGVMLINLDFWREAKVASKAIEFISNNKDIIRHPDQDALNAVLNNHWKKLHYRWNFLSSYQNTYYDKDDLLLDFNKKSINFPVIVHFSGAKPWTSRCKSIYKFEYYDIMGIANINTTKPEVSIRDNVEFYILRLLNYFKIRKLKSNYYNKSINER